MPFDANASATVKDELRQVMRLTKPKVKVTQVINADTIVVNNDETVHLPAIYIPVKSHEQTGEAVQNAKKFLEDSLLDKSVSIYQVRDQNRGQKNSLGHLEGYIVREDNLFVQEEMIKQGLAFAYPTQSHFEVADKLYAAEEIARDNKAGIWAGSDWAILNDQQAKEIKVERFAIVEGIIRGVASRNNIIYLNFERDWREDFTISVDSSLRREFSKHGHNLMQMNNQAVRVRGWMREYNGPYIEIFHPTQLEILNGFKADQTIEDDNVETPSEDSIKDRVLPNSAMFQNPTLEDLSLPEDEIDTQVKDN